MEKEKYLKVNLFVLAAVGLWPPNFKYAVSEKLYNLYSLLIITYFALFVLTEYMEIFRKLNESFFDIANNLSVSLLYTVTLFKMKITKGNQVQKFVKQIRETEQIILNGFDENLKNIYNIHIFWNRKLSFSFMSLTFCTIVPFFINPFISEWSDPIESYTKVVNNKTIYVERPLPFSSWFPFEPYKLYYLSYCLQILAGMIGAALTCTTDIFFWAFMLFGIGQIKILQYKLKNLKEDGVLYARINNVSQDNGITCVLYKSIALHQIIIRYFFALDKTVNKLMLMDFGICSMQIAVIGFQVIVSGFGWSQVFAIEYLMAMLMQMFLFYWHANEIILESLKISTAIWESNFHECSPRVQKMLILVMMRSQKPLTLKVGPFYAMSTATALSIVRVAYSYVALMRQAYK